MGSFAIMNNTPFHFLLGGSTLLLFILNLVSTNPSYQQTLKRALVGMFMLALASGLYVWTLVPFSLPLLTKSIGGIFLFWVMLQLIKSPSSVLFWGLLCATASVGLTLAFFFI